MDHPNHIFESCSGVVAVITALLLTSCTSHPPLVCDDAPAIETVVTLGRYRALSWNVWQLGWPFAPSGDSRLEHTIEWLQAEDYDVVALQELWTGSARRRMAAELGDRYEVVLGSPEVDASGTGLALLVKKDRLTLRGPDAVLVSEYVHETGDDAFKDKGFMRVRLRDMTAPEVVFDVWVTHLQADTSIFTTAKKCREVRECQTQQLVDALENERTPSTPALLMGDFNVDRPGLNCNGGEYPTLAATLQRGRANVAQPADDLFAQWLRVTGVDHPEDCGWLSYDHWVNHLESRKTREARRGKHLDYIYSMTPGAEIVGSDGRIRHPSWTDSKGRAHSHSDHYPLELTIQVPSTTGNDAR